MNDFGATVAAFVPEARALAESLMTATVVVREQTSRTAQNESTGKEEPIYEDRFASIAKFQSTRLTTDDVAVAGRNEVIDQVQIHIPVSAPQVHQDDVIECLTNPTDPRMVGRKFLVGAPFNKTHATATRLNVKEMP